MTITIPSFSLVILIGPSGSGKSTFARKHFKPTEILSSDVCRALVADSENDLSATGDAFEVLHFIAGKRLAARRLAAVDATNVQPEARKPLLELAKAHDAMPVAIVLDMPEAVCRARNAARTDRANMKPHVIHRHLDDLHRSLHKLEREGFRKVFILNTPAEVDAAEIVRERMWTDKRDDHGPFDIIGDVHSCFDELGELLGRLGYQVGEDPAALGGLGGYQVTPPQGRKAVFLGDIIDRGPRPVETLRLVMSMAQAGVAICVPGNHDVKVVKALRGKNVQRTHGLDETMAALEAETEEFRAAAARFIDQMVSHYELDDGNLVVAHAGMKEEYAGRASGRVREFALYGETTGETDEFGLPVRLNWAADYRGKATVVYGHTPVYAPAWLNNTINIDTGCCYGGALTALRYPERKLVSVPSRQTDTASARPIGPQEASLTVQQTYDTMLDIADVTGKRIIETGLVPQVIIREENSVAALEVMSRFAVDPRWLIYLPPTMPPAETSKHPDLLEHPDQVFEAFRKEGVTQVVCEEKHMGSRAVVVVCQGDEVAARRFGFEPPGGLASRDDAGDEHNLREGYAGIVYTRTGRRFFDDLAMETAFIARVRDAVTAAGLWEELSTDWLCLDAELMPWSAKAQGLLETQYAAVGAAARMGLGASIEALRETAASGIDAAELLARMEGRAEMVDDYIDAYRRYCWPVASLDDLALAPFHLLASEGAVHTDKDHIWHMETLARICRQDEKLLLATPYKVIDLNDAKGTAEGIAWWEELTGRGGEGMVTKPLDFITRGPKGLGQPAIKCRGREYLRIIYGPEYTAPEQIERLRSRGLAHKRSMALREFALGIEALERFIRREPLRRVHECVFGVLALESEPVDPRL